MQHRVSIPSIMPMNQLGVQEHACVQKRTVDSVDVACMYMCSACSELVHPAVSRVCVGGGQEPPPTSVSAARPVCGPVDKIPHLPYSSSEIPRDLTSYCNKRWEGPVASGGRDTSRVVEADGRETTASPIYPQGGWHGAAKPREGRGVRAQQSSSIL